MPHYLSNGRQNIACEDKDLGEPPRHRFRAPRLSVHYIFIAFPRHFGKPLIED